MANICEVCGKRPVAGNAVSHSGRKTRRMRVPNIQRVHAVVDGRRAWLHVCTRCIKSGRVTKAG
ncbi:MAG: 50S ribosomal protein L28 [Candidatus Bipolaricaulota bacterium]|nr:MAG: 50S ribosomal protein L28 [Candidatus Bipolaricaulota bacterium]